ncbi:GRAM domain-containing protein [Pilobolus umbonatus]|nr:GRAM domain-containing protein [Pilobolus umbonatus]
MFDSHQSMSFITSLRNRSDSNPDSVSSRKSSEGTKKKFPAQTILLKAKDSTKTLVKDVLDRRHSLELKCSSQSKPPSLDSQLSRSSSLSSLDNLKTEGRRTFRHSLLKRDRRSLPPLQSPTQSDPPSSEAAAAEADLLSGTERPGSFATACDFRLASEKKNEDFHVLFKSVQETDNLIEEYSCALQKELLLQGHLYISEHHVCFKSNIFGWVTNLVINFSEITRVEKRMTAKIIPNGITIYTDTSKHIFASILSRDQVYDQIVKIWDLNKKVSSVIHSPHTSVHADHESDDSIDSDTQSIKSMMKNNRPRSISNSYRAPVPVPQRRECPCTEQLSYVAMDYCFDGTVELVNRLLYHTEFIKRFLEKYENFEDVRIGKWKHRSREYVGQRRMKSSTGTKQVRTLFKETKLHKKLPHYMCVFTKITTPDLPLGSVYSIHSRTCITPVSPSKVRMLVTFDVVFTKTGLVSSIIEKKAVNDQLRIFKHLKSVLSHREQVETLVRQKDMVANLFHKQHIRPSPLYILLFMVVFVHILLALRLHRITAYLEQAQKRPYESNQKDSVWVQKNMGNVHNKLGLLKDQMNYYDERILRMKQTLRS